MSTFKIFLFGLAMLFSVGDKTRPAEALRTGKDYALFFAVDDYSRVPGFNDLDNPLKNARAIAAELEENYDFTTEVVPNPTLSQITQKLNEYRNRYGRNGDLDPEGQLLVFFSGHGKEEYGSGYFLPSDANPDELYRTAFAYDLWRNRIDAFQCKHILVAIDACFSALFDENFDNQSDRRFGRKNQLTERERLLADHERYKTRFFFTSDGRGDETPDKSNFAKKFLEGLRTNRSRDGLFTSSALYANYLELARPQPGGGEFGEDEPGSIFLFFKKDGPMPDTDIYTQREADFQAWTRAKEEDSMQSYQRYLADFPSGEFRRLAQDRMEALADEIDWNIAQEKNTPEAYEEYKRSHPQGKYKAQADTKLNLRTEFDIPIRSNGNSSKDLPEMVFVQGSTFKMGDQFRNDGERDEKPVHKVTVSDFFISNHEVTFVEYAEYCAAKGVSLPDDEGWGQDNRPVINVSWFDAVKYCNWRSEQEDRRPVYRISGSGVSADWTADGYRLPTEAEWEYAARSRGKKEKWAGTSRQSSLNEYANSSQKIGKTQPVKSYQPNDLGLYDMSGNVGEWCWDWYDSDYYASSQNARDPKGPSTGSYRVHRGGGWRSNSWGCRAARRNSWNPGFRSYVLGFRLALSSR